MSTPSRFSRFEGTRVISLGTNVLLNKPLSVSCEVCVNTYFVSAPIQTHRNDELTCVYTERWDGDLWRWRKNALHLRYSDNNQGCMIRRSGEIKWVNHTPVRLPPSPVQALQCKALYGSRAGVVLGFLPGLRVVVDGDHVLRAQSVLCDQHTSTESTVDLLYDNTTQP